jgi:hypothetical protein
VTVSDFPALPPKSPATPGFNPGVAPGGERILLRAAFGQDEANQGTECYPVGSDGLVWVPLEAVEPLIAKGGFVLPKNNGKPIPAGWIQLHHDDAAGCSYDGCQYSPDEDGDVLVPAEATAELLAHGFAPMIQETLPGPLRRTKPLAGSRSRKG